MSSLNPLAPSSRPFGTHEERLRHRRGLVVASGLFALVLSAIGSVALTFMLGPGCWRRAWCR